MTVLVGAGLLGGHALAVTVPVPTVPTVTVTVPHSPSPSQRRLQPSRRRPRRSPRRRRAPRCPRSHHPRYLRAPCKLRSRPQAGSAAPAAAAVSSVAGSTPAVARRDRTSSASAAPGPRPDAGRAAPLLTPLDRDERAEATPRHDLDLRSPARRPRGLRRQAALAGLPDHRALRGQCACRPQPNPLSRPREQTAARPRDLPHHSAHARRSGRSACHDRRGEGRRRRPATRSSRHARRTFAPSQQRAARQERRTRAHPKARSPRGSRRRADRSEPGTLTPEASSARPSRLPRVRFSPSWSPCSHWRSSC